MQDDLYKDMSQQFVPRRELIGMFDHLNERMDVQDEKLDSIQEHVSKTNGRVTSLEQWKAYLKGAAAVCILAFPFVVPHIHLS